MSISSRPVRDWPHDWGWRDETYLTIDGREALPVRAIPYVSGWNMSPDMVAAGLAQTDSSKRLRDVLSYRIVDDAIVAVKPMHWDNVVVALNGLDEKLPTGNAGYSEWRIEAPKLLPASVFVWLDAFAIAYGKAFSAENWICNDREGERELDLEPMIDPTTESIVMEGFVNADLLKTEDQPTNETPQNKTRLGVDRNRILAAFPPPRGVSDKNWSKRLSDPSKRMEEARVFRGGRGGVSALWNPARFAMWYAEAGYMTRPELTRKIRIDFPDYLAEWETYNDSFD